MGYIKIGRAIVKDERLHLTNELLSWTLNGKLSQSTPAHILAANLAI